MPVKTEVKIFDHLLGHCATKETPLIVLKCVKTDLRNAYEVLISYVSIEIKQLVGFFSENKPQHLCLILTYKAESAASRF